MEGNGRLKVVSEQLGSVVLSAPAAETLSLRNISTYSRIFAQIAEGATVRSCPVKPSFGSSAQGIFLPKASRASSFRST
jgi:hypothetical protein